jgi:hypothetical protein
MPKPTQSMYLTVSVMVHFLTTAWISLSVNILQFSFFCHILGLEFFYTFSSQKRSKSSIYRYNIRFCAHQNHCTPAICAVNALCLPGKSASPTQLPW